MTLELATEGCCKGHKCDNCATCRKGRCCRKDNPDYRLPELGEWDGPIFGELGVLNDDGDKIECHCCGGWYKTLLVHAYKAHGLTKQEYKAIFGLPAKQGVLTPARRAMMNTIHRRYLDQYRCDLDAVRPTPEQLSAYNRGRKMRLAVRQAMVDRGHRPPPQPPKTHCKYGHPFTDENTILTKRGYRVCRICKTRWEKGESYKRYKQSYYQAHKEEYRERGKRYYHKNIEAYRARDRRRYHTQSKGRVVPPRLRSSEYRGVTWRKAQQIWQAQIGYQGRVLYLGTYPLPEAAARAYDAKARELYGDQARLNFPEG